MRAEDLEVGMEIKGEDGNFVKVLDISVKAKTVLLYLGANDDESTGIVVPVTQGFSVK
jgi:hypothetical protein